MTVTLSAEGKGCMALNITGAASAAAAGLGSFANLEGVDVLITRATLHNITVSTGAATLSVGVTTAAASATDIVNALDVNAVSADSYYNGFVMQNTAKTAITAPAVWTAAKYVTFTGSASSAGYTGVLYLEYVRV